MVDRARRRALLSVVLGVALVAAGAAAFPQGGAEAYHHEVRAVSPSAEIPASATDRPFESLSPEGQRAFLDALEGGGTVYGEPNRPPEFVYSDHVSWEYGRYLVDYGDDRYVLTSFGDGFAFLRRVAFLLSLAVGSAFATTGWDALRRDSTRVSGTAMLGGFLGFGCVLAVGLTPGLVGWVDPRLVGVGVAVSTGAGTALTARLADPSLGPTTP